MDQTSWALRFTAHLGYTLRNFRPQFAATLGADDLAAHVRYAAELGMAGVVYPFAVERPRVEVEAVRDALVEYALQASFLLSMPFAVARTPIWSDRSPSGRSVLEGHIRSAAEAASELGSTTLIAIVANDLDVPTDEQLDRVAENLHAMADIADAYGLKIGVEPLVRLPDMLLTSTDAAAQLIDLAEHHGLGLVFDTAHVATMNEDIFVAFTTHYDKILSLQFADEPDRVEPGAGTLDLVSVAAEAVRRGYSGLVDLEHDWSMPDAEGEENGIERLRQFNARITAALTMS